MRKIIIAATLLCLPALASANCGYVNGNYVCNYGGNTGSINGKAWSHYNYGGGQGSGTIGGRSYNSSIYGNQSNIRFDNGQSVNCWTTGTMTTCN